jgi:hypothetical protein
VVGENADKGWTFIAQVYLVKQRAYTLLVVQPSERSETAEVRQFLDSFRLTR